MKRAYFQYYETFEKIVQKFHTAEEQNALRGKIIAYGLYGQEPDGLTEKEELVWDVIEDLISDQVHRREVNKANRAARSKKKEEAAAIAPEYVPLEDVEEVPLPEEAPAPKVPRNVYEEIEQAYLDNWQKLYEGHYVTTEQPVLVYSAVRKQIKQLLAHYTKDQLIKALERAMSDEFCLKAGYGLLTILSSGVLNRLVNGSDKKPHTGLKADNAAGQHFDCERYE